VRPIVTPANSGGTACTAETTDSRNGNVHPCAADCTFKWNDWFSCTKSCGAGKQTRDHNVVQATAHGGDEYPASEERVCHAQACPVDCSMSAWASWSACTKPCSTGTHASNRTIISGPIHGGKTSN
jgi:hypothetical protein